MRGRAERVVGEAATAVGPAGPRVMSGDAEIRDEECVLFVALGRARGNWEKSGEGRMWETTEGRLMERGDAQLAELDVLAGLFELDEEEQEWQERALCAQTDPEAFFPEKGGSTREAKRICAGCEVRAECLEYALEHDERFGIWGGLSERERRKLKRRAV